MEESIFNKDFYPTPPEVIQLMVNGTDLNGKTVLEPSAGNGNIVDFCIGSGASLLACELNEDLAKIVSSKCQFLKHDFLEVESHEISHIDYIFMNPPFSADEKHILHAWKIAPDGCEIVALCNYETLNKSNYTRSREELKRLVSDYGNSGNIGDVFSNAERKTGIDIGLVRLYKPKTSNDFGDYFESEDDAPEIEQNGIMSYNAVREIVQRYVNAVKLYDEVIANGVKMNDLIGTFSYVKDLTFVCTVNDKETTKQTFQKELQKKAWNWIFSKMNMNKYMTKSLKEDINKFVEQQTKIPFTMKNIYKMMELVIGTQSQRMDKALLEVFDVLTERYHENRYNVEGWKTNSHYLVNKKFIMPYIAPQSSYSNSPSVNDRQAEIVDDFMKSLCYITGTNYDEIVSFYQRVSKGVEWGQWFDWHFFEVRLYKKGTGHFKFKNEDHWAMFNIHIARIKGYPLPESMKGSRL